MTIQTTRADLRAALALVTPAADPKSSIAIMDGVMVEPCEGGARLSCTGGIMAASTVLACDGGQDAFVVTADTFRRVIDSLPDGEVKLTAKDGRVTIAGGNSKAKLPTRDAREFPKIHQAPEAQAKIEVQTLRKLFWATRHGSQIGSTMPAMDGTCLVAEDGAITATAAHGHGVARAWAKCETIGKLAAHVSSSVVIAILKAIAALDADDIVPLAVEGQRLFVAHASAQMYGEEPAATDRILRAIKTPDKLTINREQLIAAVKRVGITADCAHVQLVSDGEGGLVVSSESVAGESETVLSALGPECRILIAAHLLLPHLEQVSEDECEIATDTSKPAEPLVFRSSNYLGVAMPLRPGAR